MKHLGLAIIGMGALLVLVGLGLLLADRLPSWLGHLPGDIHLRSRSGSFAFAFPIVTCLLVSAVLSLLLNLLARWFR